MLGDKNWDEREGDSYKTIYSVLADLVLVAWSPGRLVAWSPGRLVCCDKKPTSALY